MLKHGITGINAIYKSNTKMGRVYKGTQLVYQSRRLPSDYVEVEYLESHGTEYIDTGFIANQDSRVIMDIQPTTNNQNGRGLYGSIDANNQHRFEIYINSSNKIEWGYGSYYYPATTDFGTSRITLDQNKNICYINGIVDTTRPVETFTCVSNFYLFNMNRTPALGGVLIKLYSCKIYDNNTLVRDFIPAVRLSDGEAGLYDVVNDVFYTNQGTGKFTYGEFKNIPDGYAKVDLGTIEYQKFPTVTNSYYFRATLNPLPKRASSGTTKANLYCSKYKNTGGLYVYQAIEDNTIAIPHDNDIVMIYDESKKDLTTVEFKTVNSGVWILYEKA